ncbi:hypothetical protein [Cellulomonas endophytica]|uniref:hypothetical protein n=1 Tax=Cellulomonas endophytica TaxID=2494735 RepID=UPI001011518D|nr:hypothetical protein [Cellulomonas endophytica]
MDGATAGGDDDSSAALVQQLEDAVPTGFSLASTQPTAVPAADAGHDAPATLLAFEGTAPPPAVVRCTRTSRRS